MIIEFRDKNNGYIKQWSNWPGELIPVRGDDVLIHYGDNNEVEVRYTVVKCVINGLDPHKLICIID